MVSRKTTKLIAEFYASHFTKTYDGPYATRTITDGAVLYDFLYEHGYDAWFCNMARKQESTGGTRPLKDFIMRLHTGESLTEATAEWSWKQREKLGQRYLEELAEDALQRWANAKQYMSDKVEPIRRSLELDGYEFKDNTLLAPEQDVIDAQEEASVIRSLFKELGLGDEESAFTFLESSDDHYLNGRWADAIHNSRKFLESILLGVASRNARVAEKRDLSEGAKESPAAIRSYLEKQGLLESKEVKALSAVYGLLSHTGGHPYMAEADQARLLRHLAMTFSHFVMLRLRGRTSAAG
jgi:hypothetical protein